MVNNGVDLFAVGKVASYQPSQRYSHLANDTLLKAVKGCCHLWTAPALQG